MNKFRYYSDLHDFPPDFVRESDKSEICIVAGDCTEFRGKGTNLVSLLERLCQRFKEVIFVPGNHEYYGTHIGTLERKLSMLMSDVNNFVLLQGGDYIDRDKVRIIGATLWTDTSSIEFDAENGMNDYRYIRIGPDSAPWKRTLKPSDTTLIHRSHVQKIYKALEDWEGDSIVITHHAPSDKSLDPRYEGSILNKCYATELELAKWPTYWIHGHIHRVQNYMHNGCNILCNPGGYPGEYTGFEPLENYFYL